MNIHIAAESLRQKYLHDPLTATCLNDCFEFMQGLTQTIFDLTAKLKARSAVEER